MKKILFSALQLLSLFLFLVLFRGTYSIVIDVLTNGKEAAYNFGYSLAAAFVLTLYFWLNVKLFKYASRKANE